MSAQERARAMAASVARTLRSHGMDAAGLSLLNRAHALAMEPRLGLIDDERHPMLLHPGHTALVLVHDVGARDAGLLAAAAVTESEDGAFRVERARVRAVLGDRVAELASAVPEARAPDLAEALVTASREVRLVALAERLDHLRHAHLRTDPEWGRAAHREAMHVYLPVAERTDERLAARYRYWCRKFAGRFGEPGRLGRHDAGGDERGGEDTAW